MGFDLYMFISWIWFKNLVELSGGLVIVCLRDQLMLEKRSSIIFNQMNLKINVEFLLHEAPLLASNMHQIPNAITPRVHVELFFPISNSCEVLVFITFYLLAN